MGITQAQAKATSTNAKQTTAPAYTAHRYTAHRYTALRYTINRYTAHHSIALIILIFSDSTCCSMPIATPLPLYYPSQSRPRNTADLKTVNIL